MNQTTELLTKRQIECLRYYAPNNIKSAVIASYKAGILSDCQLWELLSSGAYIPVTIAKDIYQDLGFIPFSGYPLVKVAR